jgi:hypothetical protein
MKKLKGPQIKAPQVKTPQVFSDVYRDLRDRRLLLPVAAVLVSILAVPVLLKGGGSDSAPPPLAPSPAGDEVTAVAPAVLVADSGVRDYRKRLAALKSKNPFEQKFALPTPESVALQGDSGGGTSTDTTSTSTSITDTAGLGSAGTVADSSSSSTSVTDTTVTDNGDEVTTSTDTVTSDTTAGGHPKPPETTSRFYAGRIDVTVGPAGDAKRINDVRDLEFLPSEKDPVVAFLGLSHGAEAAVFSVSRDVVETDGDGSCSPKKPAPCEYLTLHQGDRQTFSLADGSTFRLRLLHTKVVAVPDPRTQQGADQADASGG